MTDEKGLESKVVYNGSKPDGFDQSEKIVIAGKYLYDAGNFSNQEVCAKARMPW